VEYKEDSIIFGGNIFKGEGEQTLVHAFANRSARVHTYGSTAEKGYHPRTEGNVILAADDLGFRQE
jgi:hypothetical protein